jgi:hypothetical protein
MLLLDLLDATIPQNSDENEITDEYRGQEG